MNTPWVEQNCIIEYNEQQFESGGAVVTDDYLIAYPAENGILTDWHGNKIGTWYVISWRDAVFFGYPSTWGSKYYYMRGIVNNRHYSLRGFGVNMVASGRALKVQPHE
jgi:hypothetical protein